MKRVHVLEFEDLDWFPAWLRRAMTNVLVVLARKIGVVDVLGKLVARVAREEGIDRIVDLGSGAGGSMPDVLEVVRRDPATKDVTLLMTDLHPNTDAAARWTEPPLRYDPNPVDATDLASAPAGLKTMVNCFHHMRPEQARTILASAKESRQPLLIYEMGDNKLPFWLWCIALPLALPLVALSALFLTPLVRPLTFRQVFFTYAVPIIPFFYAWDGQASVPRIYTMEDLDELLEGLQGDDYRWEKDIAKTDKGRALGIYLRGRPV